MLRRINLSAAVIVLVCFFLPWVQVSCAGAKETMSGLNLARNGDAFLLLIPLLMGAVLVLGLLRAHRESSKVFAVTSAICGAVVLLLLNRERGQVQDESGLIAAQLTGWFWLAFISAGAIVVTALALVLRRERAPDNSE
jgi:threonine/homoserine efflux transporter RhtA